MQSTDLVTWLTILNRYKWLIFGVPIVLSVLLYIILLVFVQNKHEFSTEFIPGGYWDQDQRTFIFFSTPQDITSRIRSGSFDQALLQEMDWEQSGEIELNSTVPRNSDLVRVTWRGTKDEDGLKLLQTLIDLISEENSEELEQQRSFLLLEKERIQEEINNAERTIEILTNKKTNFEQLREAELNTIDQQIEGYQANMELSQKRIVSLEQNLNTLNTEFASLVSQRNTILKENPRENIDFQKLWFFDVIQRNTSYVNQLTGEINTHERITQQLTTNISEARARKVTTDHQYTTEILKTDSDIEASTRTIQLNKVALKTFDWRIENLRNLQVLTSPQISILPVEPSKAIYVGASFTLSLLLALFVAYAHYKYRKAVSKLD